MDVQIKTRSEFDQQAVRREMDRRAGRFLGRFGEHVALDARDSIKPSADGKSSRPGETPRSHTGKLRQGIVYGFDDQQKSVVIGTTKTSGKASGNTGENVPLILETGGRIKRRVIRYAEDRIVKREISNATAVGWNEVTKASWRSGGWGKVGAVVLIAARPFLKPAMDRAIFETVRFWDNTTDG